MKWTKESSKHWVCGRFTICAAWVGDKLRYTLSDGVLLVGSYDTAEECRQEAARRL